MPERVSGLTQARSPLPARLEDGGRPDNTRLSGRVSPEEASTAWTHGGLADGKPAQRFNLEGQAALSPRRCAALGGAARSGTKKLLEDLPGL